MIIYIYIIYLFVIPFQTSCSLASTILCRSSGTYIFLVEVFCSTLLWWIWQWCATCSVYWQKVVYSAYALPFQMFWFVYITDLHIYFMLSPMSGQKTDDIHLDFKSNRLAQPAVVSTGYNTLMLVKHWIILALSIFQRSPEVCTPVPAAFKHTSVLCFGWWCCK